MSVMLPCVQHDAQSKFFRILQRLQQHTMQHSLLPKGWDFIAESYPEATTRYAGFGEHLFVRMAERIPDAFANLKFFRSTDFQSEDIYAIYASPNKVFAIQLDPSCSVICLWDKVDHHIEISNWFPDVYEEAINFMQEHFLSQT